MNTASFPRAHQSLLLAALMLLVPVAGATINVSLSNETIEEVADEIPCEQGTQPLFGCEAWVQDTMGLTHAYRTALAGPVVATMGSNAANDPTLVGLDSATGAALWSTSWHFPGGFAAPDGLVAGGNDFYVSMTVYNWGGQGSGGPYTHEVVAAVDGATGTQRWTVETDQAVDGNFAGLAASRDGALLAQAVFGLEDAAVRAIDTATGNEAWRTVLFDVDGLQSLYDVAFTPDSTHVIAVGSSYFPGEDYYSYDLDIFGIVAAADASSASTFEYDGGGLEYGLRVAATDDRIFLAGLQSGRILGLAFTMDGTLEWVTLTEFECGPQGVAVSPDGSRMVIAGLTGGPTGVDYGAIAFDGDTGAVAWTLVRDEGGSESFGDVIASPTGDVAYFLGLEFTEGAYRAATFAVGIDDGTVEWKALYSPSGSSFTYGTGLAADDERVYVSGVTTAVVGTGFLVAYDVDGPRALQGDVPPFEVHCQVKTTGNVGARCNG